MTESTNNEPENKQPDELTLLKKRADQIGVKYRADIGVDRLRVKINAKLNTENDEPNTLVEKEVTTKTNIPPTQKIPTPLTIGQKREASRKDAARMVRVVVNCMNPAKKEYEGEIFTVSNSLVGTFKKYVSYNNEEGWHIPNIIYQHLLERQCQIFYSAKGPRGNKIRKGKLIKEFSITLLPPLTGAELTELARKQAMANNLD